MDDTNTPMLRRWVIALASYLLITTLASVWAIYSLWSAQSPKGESVPAVTCPASSPAPTFSRVSPSSVNAGSTADVLILGCGFTADTRVAFNGTAHPSLLIDPSHIRITLAAGEAAIASDIPITVYQATTPVGTLILRVVPATLAWRPFPLGTFFITLEGQLLMMVLFTGAFGSCVYALKSLADYRGDNKLYQSWLLFYLIQPLEGAGIALLMYFLIRGGFLGGTSADIKTVNQFGMCAIAGLAGAFSDTAFLKLREVFQTLFKPQDDRGGKIELKISTTTLPDGAVGKPYQQKLEASGGTRPFKWSVSPSLPDGLTLDPQSGSITGTPKVVLPKTPYQFTVEDSAPTPASTSATISFEIKAA